MKLTWQSAKKENKCWLIQKGGRIGLKTKNNFSRLARVYTFVKMYSILTDLYLIGKTFERKEKKFEWNKIKWNKIKWNKIKWDKFELSLSNKFESSEIQ